MRTNSLFFILALFLSVSYCEFLSLSEPTEVGYRVGKVIGNKTLRTSQKSKLYELIVPELDDKRPIKLIDLHGSHYQIGFDYGYLLSDEIEFTYKALFEDEFKNNKTLLEIFERFFDWQYHSYLKKEIPLEFISEIRGVADGAFKAKKSHKIKKILQRSLVISSIPSTFTDDLPAVLWDEFFRTILRIKNERISNYIESNLLYVITKMKQYFKKMSIMCSFFGVWGSRTLNG